METETKEIQPQLARWRELKSDPERLLAAIVEHLTLGHGLVNFTKLYGLAYKTVWDWIHADQRREQIYQSARTDGAWALYEQAAAILDQPPKLDENGKVDMAWVQLQRARSDIRKWQASKMIPRVFGDKLEVSAPVTYDLTAAMAKAQERFERQRLERLNLLPEFLPKNEGVN